MSTRLRARAKVNLRLRVLGRRADGYHELATLFDRISLADAIELEPAATLSLECDVPGIPEGPQNLAWRAAAAALGAANDRARSASGSLGDRARGGAVAIRLTKGVPAGAGLGGGSADAAAVLVGTDRLLGLRLGETTLLAVARSLGADVPFFVHGHLRDEEDSGSGRMAFGTGVGEVLTRVSSPPALFYVLMNPGFEVSTARVFQAGGFGPLPEGAADDGVAQGKPETIDDVLSLLRNDLEPVTSGMHPEVAALVGGLREEGALGARMSGSGPTVFGVFASEAAARVASERLIDRFPSTRVFVARGE